MNQEKLKQLRHERIINRATVMVHYRETVDSIRDLFIDGRLSVGELISAVQTAAIEMTNRAADVEHQYAVALKELEPSE